MKTFHPEVKAIAKAAFPEYKGRKFYVEVANPEHVYNLNSNWCGGSRDFFAFVNLDDINMKAQVPQNGTMFDTGRSITLPNPGIPVNCALVRHTIFCGHDLGITVIVNAANMPAQLTTEAK